MKWNSLVLVDCQFYIVIVASWYSTKNGYSYVTDIYCSQFLVNRLFDAIV